MSNLIKIKTPKASRANSTIVTSAGEVKFDDKCESYVEPEIAAKLVKNQPESFTLANPEDLENLPSGEVSNDAAKLETAALELAGYKADNAQLKEDISGVKDKNKILLQENISIAAELKAAKEEIIGLKGGMSDKAVEKITGTAEELAAEATTPEATTPEATIPEESQVEGNGNGDGDNDGPTEEEIAEEKEMKADLSKKTVPELKDMCVNLNMEEEVYGKLNKEPLIDALIIEIKKDAGE